MAMHLSMMADEDRQSLVRYYPSRNDDYEVQILFGGRAYQTLYMDAATARSLAEQILAAVPAPEVQP